MEKQVVVVVIVVEVVVMVVVVVMCVFKWKTGGVSSGIQVVMRGGGVCTVILMVYYVTQWGKGWKVSYGRDLSPKKRKIAAVKET